MTILRVLVVLGIVTAVPNLMADAATIDKFPFLFDITPTTCPEAPSHITGSGSFMVVTRFNTTPSGGTHLGLTFTGHGVATDASGGVWSLSDADNGVSLNIAPGGTLSMTVTEGFHLVSRGNGKNIMVIAVAHITVLADGSVKVDFARERGASEACEGFIFP